MNEIRLPIEELIKLPDNTLIKLGLNIIKARELKRAKNYNLSTDILWRQEPPNILKDIGQFVDLYI